MTSCNFCKIREICVFRDAFVKAISSHEDKYFPSFTEALSSIEQAVAEHCIYFAPVGPPGKAEE